MKKWQKNCWKSEESNNHDALLVAEVQYKNRMQIKTQKTLKLHCKTEHGLS